MRKRKNRRCRINGLASKARARLSSIPFLSCLDTAQEPNYKVLLTKSLEIVSSL